MCPRRCSIGIRLIYKDILLHLLNYLGRAVVPLNLCSTYSTRSYYLEYEPFTHGFHMVIGDNILDSIYAWNHALTWDTGFGGRMVVRRDVLWLSEELSRDEDLFGQAADLVEKSMWAFNETERHGKVISYSVNEDELRRIAEKLTGLTHFRFEPLNLPPNKFPLGERRLFNRPPEGETNSVPISENKGQVSIPRPPFLRKNAIPRWGGWLT